MKRHSNPICHSWATAVGIFFAMSMLSAIAWAGTTGSGAAKPPQDPGWPREFDRNGARLVVYQPQIDHWERFRVLTADTAVSLSLPDHKPAVGVISWQANTVPDLSNRTVAINDIRIISARFPSLDPAAAAAAQSKLMQVYPATGLVISMDRMLAGFRAEKAAPAPALNTDPPPIYVSMAPAILLFVDGEPIRVPIQGTKLGYVVNTTWDLFYEGSNYYLLDNTTWLTATALTGPWKTTTTVPSDMAKVPSVNNWQEVKKALPPKPGSGPAPVVFFTSKPAELLVFKGEPAFAAIPPTSLNYATNTVSQVFQYSVNHQYYALLSGRWFSAPSLNGPWTYAGGDLPGDFQNIPPNSPAASVLASVPGTQQAHDALLLAQIPTIAIINKQQAEAQVKVQYTGPPKFAPIETTTLSYAVNTNDKVIKIGDLYYLCFQGVWFMSTTPNGPWKAADSVPPVIYTIPPTSPLYNVTYVTVYDPTPTTVTTSYTAGYMGMFILGYGIGSSTVVYGTGYYYPPYFYVGPYPYPIYYPWPCTYGVGAVYHPYTGAYSYSQVVYGPYASAGRTAWYNPTTGTYGRAVTYQNAYGGSTYAQAYNPWTGNYAATQQHHNEYAQWGSSVVSTPYQTVNTQHYSNANGTAASYQTSQGGKGAAVTGPGDNTYYHGTTNSGTQYAGKDGNVYKQNSDGTWSKYSNGSWTPVNTDQAEQQTKQAAQNSKAGQNVTRSSTTTQTKNGGTVSSNTVTDSKGGSVSSYTGPNGQTGYVANGANNNVYAGKDGNVYKQSSDGSWSKYDNGSWNQVPAPSNSGRTQSTPPASTPPASTPPGSARAGGSGDVSSDTFQQLNDDANARRGGNGRQGGGFGGGGGGRGRR